MDKDGYIFSLQLKVRDYEIDAEGIVNNAVYLHYLEHTRHEFCRKAGFSFRQMRQEGIDPVLNRIEIEYKKPLRSGDEFFSRLNMSRHGVRFVFRQDIYDASGDIVVKAVVEVVCLENGKLSRGDLLAEKFRDFL